MTETKRIDDLGNSLPYHMEFWHHRTRFINKDNTVRLREYPRYRLRAQTPIGRVEGPTFSDFASASAALPDWLKKVGAI
jgi:ligand-binding SRPBCC domain-containing protein